VVNLSSDSFEELARHVGHKVEVVRYEGSYSLGGKPSKKLTANVAIECLDCNEVLLDYDNPAIGGDDGTIPLKDG